MHLFYCPDIVKTMTLPEEESKHCVRVLRLVEGDTIDIVDGCGNWYEARITMAHPKRCAVEFVGQRRVEQHWGHRIVLGIAPTKNIDRTEWAVEKTTEMGVDRIIPLLCRHSERKELKCERLRKIAVSAMKQSLKATLPQVDDMMPFAKAISIPFDGNKFIAYCDSSLPVDQRSLLAQRFQPGHDTFLLIGPEGDFSPEEVQSALDAGFIPIGLGDSRLRTETAAVFAVMACHTLDQQQK
ncbi:MAG: 16S rRNA (uracil(1498)-N(3))-methyltransferase [Bacteroidales bacterium]|nr:16S rRNA (uracil(1498)-N(3))-methyltransferase [Candidatus Sodaliphilus aphodohippi]